jgi:Ni/Fe-hydrogenase subunit HybB-like protein
VNSANNTRVVVTKTVLWTLLGMACAVIVYRFAFGLGSATALSDLNPWGMWIGFDVLSGVALAAGGFVIAATVHIFRLEKYHALVRPAILTAFLGYLAVILGLLVDLGRPWNLWRPIFYWQPDSPLFEVAWCVILYTNVLALEFAPVVFEGLRLEKPRRWLRRITIPLVIAGIGLSTLHQSSLGTLFLLSRDRIHPLWDSPVIFLQFLVTAVALGLVMVTTESVVSSWLYRRKAEWPLLKGLTRIAAVVLGLYLVLRLGDLAWRGSLRYVLEGSWASTLFVVELLISAVIPIVLFTLPSLRKRQGAVAVGAMLGVAGFILHRANVGGIAHIPMTGQAYVPALTELIVSAGVVSAMALVFLFFVERFPVWEERPPVPDHFTAPMRDPVSRTFFGGPWFSRFHLGALGWVVGAILGVVVLEVTAVDFLAPKPSPVRPARTVRVVRSELPSGVGNQLRLLEARQTPVSPSGEVVPALLIDGDRSGTYVLFEHDAHQKRLGGMESCGRCHHRNLTLDLGSPCVSCHRDMYRQSDTYSHERHVRVLGGNRSCARCHADATAPKTRAGSKPCKECHQADTHPTPFIQAATERTPGMATGYRTAMHGLCVSCHLEEDRKKGAEEPYLSRCTACHRNVSGEGDEMRLREGWTLSARLVQR